MGARRETISDVDPIPSRIHAQALQAFAAGDAKRFSVTSCSSRTDARGKETPDGDRARAAGAVLVSAFHVYAPSKSAMSHTRSVSPAAIAGVTRREP